MEKLPEAMMLVYDSDQPYVSFEEEYKKVAAEYDADSQAMKSNIYPIIRDMLDDKITREEAIDLFVLDDWHLAKRQLTWFKRNSNIIWLPLDEAREFLLNTYA